MQKSINAIRVLSIDMIQKANSGHPGICMGAAPIMYTLFKNHIAIDHDNDKNPIRDRFVLSAGHGSAMLYATLYLSGLTLTKDDLKKFRQVDSKTPGHPEITHTDFVDSTSGPLGQGIAQAVGMAMAEAHNGAKYNKVSKVVDNYTYVLCGDGDLQEGVSHEASSVAGHFNLNKLIILWDSNDIQLDYPTEVAVSENIKKRYEAYGFNTIEVKNGDDQKEIDKAIKSAKKSDKPTLIEVKTKIGCGSPKNEGKTSAHGAPLGEEEACITKERYGWTLDKFEVDQEVFDDFELNIKKRFANKKEQYLKNLEELNKKDEKLFEEYKKVVEQKVDMHIDFDYEQLGTSIASRVASGKSLNKINDQIPNLFGGSADLSKSNNSNLDNSGIFSKDSYENKNIPFGVREFGMAAITNGIHLYGMNKTYCATFFVFSDYLKAAIRMSAIEQIPTIYVLTHDSIAVGEDGPTHEPVEQLTGLRAIPNVSVIRPCDFNETQVAYEVALNSKKTPTVLVLSRQNLKTISSSKMAQNLKRGAYIVSEDEGFEKILIATGSEVSLALEAKEELNKKDIKVKVISMPSSNLFDKQDENYKKEILGGVCHFSKFYIEMSTATIGYKYAGNVINISDFGKSGKGDEVIKAFNFTKEHVAQVVESAIKKESCE